MIKVGRLMQFITIFILSGCLMTITTSDPILFQESPYRALDTMDKGILLHVPTGKELNRQELLHFLKNIRIIYIGESHTNLLHHQIQLDIIKGLEEYFPGNIVVGMEMFDRPFQSDLDRWSRGAFDEKSFQKVWYKNWDEDFAYYKDILYFIREKGIPLIALNISDEIVHLVAQTDTEELSEDVRKKLPDIDTTDPYHRKILEAIYQGHIPGKGHFDHFYQTMLLWDETMAESIEDYLTRSEGLGKKMVVLAGSGHLRYGFGIPRRVFRRLPEPYTIILPYTIEIPEGKEYLLMDVTIPDVPLYIADFVWATGYEDLETKQVRLGVGIEPSEKGVQIRTVEPESAAAKAGIKVGDVLTLLDGEPIQEPFDLIYAVRQRQPGGRISFQVYRGEEILELEVTF